MAGGNPGKASTQPGAITTRTHTLNGAATSSESVAGGRLTVVVLDLNRYRLVEEECYQLNICNSVSVKTIFACATDNAQ